MTALGYVSTNGATRIGDRELARQLTLLKRWCASVGWTLSSTVYEVQPATCRRSSVRPALSDALERLAAGEASCLVVADLGGLCRSVAELHDVMRALDRVGARLVSLFPRIDTGTKAGRDAARILCAVSDWEHRRAAERSRRALAVARAKGAIAPAMEPKLQRRIRRMRQAGMTLQAIVDELNADGVPTPRGGAKWRPSSVQAAVGYKRPRQRG